MFANRVRALVAPHPRTGARQISEDAVVLFAHRNFVGRCDTGGTGHDTLGAAVTELAGSDRTHPPGARIVARKGY